MKKYLSLITAGTLCATLIPLASATGNSRYSTPRSSHAKSAMSRVSRRVLESGTWAYRARVRHFKNTTTFATDKPMSSSSSSVRSSASTSSSMSSSASSN